VKGSWTPRPGWRGVRQLSIGGLAEAYLTHAGQTESKTGLGEFAVTFSDTSVLGVEAGRDYDLLTVPWQLGHGVVPPGGYYWNTVRTSYTSSPRHRIGGTGYVETGGYYTGDKTTFSGSLTLIPRDTLTMDLGYSHNSIALPATPTYVTNAVSTRVSYSLSPTLFTKAFVQYNDDRRQASLNLLFWWIYRPGSDLYLVYNQGWDTDLAGPHWAQVKTRSIAVKLTYWLSR